ncbi:hypothetical protein BY458DRAFT_556454 [Sporodiniella umbellata]|nr:hypothetical protein BY458DRAFT_556454 [Sporodiniella umbellata]
MSEDPFALPSNNPFSVSSPLSFTVEDPWNLGSFDENITQPLTSIPEGLAIQEEVVTEGITAANALVGVDLPEIFDTAYIRAGPTGDRVRTESLEVIVGLGGLGPRLYEQVVPAGAMYVTRNEFNTALALVGCAQKNMNVSLVTVYQHRNDLPIPLLPNLELVSMKQARPKQSNYDDDPWQPSPGYSEESSKKKANGKKPAVHDKKSSEWFSDLDQVSVTIAEKEGFLFPHINYWVQSSQRQKSVRRRFSDFYWFWETLMKRYPFRLVPSLPPKKFSGKDQEFIKQRCHGLLNFINAVVKHPVLKKDELVTIFLTEETEFSAWRKGASVPSSDEEFVRVNPNTEDYEPLVPEDLDARVKTIRDRLPKKIDLYDRLCASIEHTVRLKKEKVDELQRFDKTLKELGKVEHTCFVPGCQACPPIIQGYESVGDYMKEQSLTLQREILSTKTGILESLRQHKDISVCFLELLERKSRLQVHQMESLAEKIAANTAKVNQHRGVPGFENEVERLDVAIQSDKERIRYQQRRDIYIRYCTASELSFYHKQQAFVSLLYQNYVHEQLQLSRKTIDNWKSLEALLCNLPKPEDLL